MWSYNKGEWSEIYTFSYLLSNGVLHSADKDLNTLEDVYFPIIKIIREEVEGNKIDYYTGNTIKIYKGEELLLEIQKQEFENITSLLLDRIPKGSSAFQIPEAEEFFNNIYCYKVKANSNSKEDITIQLHDIKTGISPVMGFSIKSFIGSNPTLINAGRNTNFKFMVSNCNDELMERVNSIETKTKMIDRIELLKSSGCVLVPIEHSISKQFETNLQFIDTAMPSILQYFVFVSYWYNIRNVIDITNKLKEINPLELPHKEMYPYKIKKMLCAFALGLFPEKKDWLGAEDANGGYITVKADGSIVCYHLYNRTDFEDYLLNYTFLEKASSSRHNFMSIFKENDNYYINLNLQIRFR